MPRHLLVVKLLYHHLIDDRNTVTINGTKPKMRLKKSASQLLRVSLLGSLFIAVVNIYDLNTEILMKIKISSCSHFLINI